VNKIFKPGKKLTATSLVTTIQAFITGAAAHHDMTAYVTGWCITLHILRDGIHCFHSTVWFTTLCGTLIF
jgi:hypothetical protein